MKTLALLIFVAVLSCSARAADIYPFGRLFTDPAERQQIDHLRDNIEKNASSPVEAATAPGPEAREQTLNASNVLRFSGYMRRSSGDYIVWVNSESSLTKDSLAQPYAVLVPEKKQVLLRVNSQQALMKPGQVWLLDTNKIEESYDYRPGLLQAIDDTTSEP